MAPNRKSFSALVQTLSTQDLAELQNAVQPKYLPLTHPAASHQLVESKPKQQHQADSASYWGWESTPEPTVCVLSTDNIISNLIADTANCDGENSVTWLAENDDYWAEEAEATMPQQGVPAVETSYWDWPAEQDIDDRLALEDVIHSDGMSGVSGMLSSATVSADDYWAW